MTVQGYLTHIARLKNIPASEQRHAVFQVIEQCDLTAATKRHIGKLSGGNRQRCGLAQALLGNPALLVLDEPTAGLDPAQIAIFRALIRRLAGDHTILVSTHIMAEVEACCDRVVMIHQGRNLLDETVHDFQARRQEQSELRLKLVEAQAQQLADAWHAQHDQTIEVVHDHELRLPGNIDRDAVVTTAIQHGGVAELVAKQRSLEEVFSQLIAAETPSS